MYYKHIRVVIIKLHTNPSRLGLKSYPALPPTAPINGCALSGPFMAVISKGAPWKSPPGSRTVSAFARVPYVYDL